MILLWLLLPVAPISVAIGAFFALRSRFPGEYHDHFGLMLTCIIPAVVMAGGLSAPTVRQMDHHYGSRACYRYGDHVEREVRYITNSYWDYGCYVRTDSGNWVERDKVTETELRGGRAVTP